MGEPRSALDPTRQAADIYRRLAETEPTAHLPNLATTLNNLGIRLLEVGDTRAALDPTRQAADIYQQLAEIEPTAHLRRLAETEPAAHLPNSAMC